MPRQSQRIFSTQTTRFSKTVDAPVRYVYDWCTDFRSDDGKFSRTRPKFTVLRVAPNRIVRIRRSQSAKEAAVFALELIRLNPPNSWHVDQIDENDLEATDYRLKRLGPRRTRVTLTITERWMTPEFPSAKEYRTSSSAYWDRLMAALAARYRSGKPARG